MPQPSFHTSYIQNDHKILLIIISGLGGIQSGPNMLTELQQAHKPNLNALARKAACGLINVVAPGQIPAPGSGLYHLLGYSRFEEISGSPLFYDRYGLSACLITTSPDFDRNFSTLGIDVFRYDSDPCLGISLVREKYPDYTFLILHITRLEHPGMSGDYYEKVKAIEELDKCLDAVIDLKSTVLAITGDSSLPTALGAVSWHSVPLLICSTNCRFDYVQSFDEIVCSHGGLGILSSKDIMPLLMASAGKAKAV